MVEILARNWGWVLVRGILAILFGIFALMNPGVALATLVLVYGAYAFADGLLVVVSTLANRRQEPRWVALLFGGILGIAAGILTFIWPQITAVVLLAIIAVWAIIIGIAETVAAIQLRKVIPNEWLLILAGLASVAFGIFLIARPAAGALAVILWIGSYALLSGILITGFAFRLRSWGRDMSPATADAKRRHAVA